MILQGLFNKPSTSVISQILTISEAQGNANVTLIENSDFIKAHF